MLSAFCHRESPFYDDRYHITITQVNVRLTGTHHFDIVNLGEAPDEDVDGDKGGGVRVVDARGSDPGVVHLGVHQRVEDPLLYLPGQGDNLSVCYVP